MQNNRLQDFSDNFLSYIHPHLIDLCKHYNVTPQELRALYDCIELKEENYVEKFADFLGDMYVVEAFHRMIKLQVLKNTAPIYFYNFTYDQGISLTKLLINSSMSGNFYFYFTQ